MLGACSIAYRQPTGVWAVELPVGRRVRMRREALGLSIQQLSRLSGVSASYISRLENGERENIGLDSVQKLARALNTSMSYLVGETDDPSPPPQMGVAAHREGADPGDPLEPEVQLIIERAVREVLKRRDEWLRQRQREQQGDAPGGRPPVSDR